MTQAQIEKYEQLRDKINKCVIALTFSIEGVIHKGNLDYIHYHLPEEVCSEITDVINKWKDHYKNEIEKI